MRDWIIPLGFLATAGLVASQDPVINLPYLSIRGNATLPGVHFFGGIPYIQPPVGNLRFRAPLALDETANSQRPIHDGRNWGYMCVQQPAVVGIGNEGAFGVSLGRLKRSD